MVKLGKKARKFAKKHLQSVLRQRRKTKASFKKKASKNAHNDVEEEVEIPVLLSNGRNTESEGILNVSLDKLFIENELDEIGDASESDGYLSEDPTSPYFLESGAGRTREDEIATSSYFTQNKKIYADISSQKTKLEKLKKKDPNFSKFLESFNNVADTFGNEDGDSDEGDSSDQTELGDAEVAKAKGRLLTNHVITTWYQMVREDKNQPALVSLLNAYRAACHYGAEAIGYGIENSETFCNILLFTLSSAADFFQDLLQISSSKSDKKILLELKKTSKWESVKPLVKSYVRSTLFLLSQVTDTNILTFAMTRLRFSLIFFAAFPALIPPLVKATVHLWATGERALSLASFLVMRDLVDRFGSISSVSCLSKAFVAFLARSRVAEIADITCIQFLRDCLVDLCSFDVQKSSVKAFASMNQLSEVLIWGLQTKKKEPIRKICSWEYVNCIDLWVRFIADNIHEYEFHDLFFMATQLINGLAHMFPGPRYFPLRVKCIEWLNYLSISSGKFIPLASLVLDILEYKFVKEGRKAGESIKISSLLKLPKHYLKSKTFQEECFRSAVEQLSDHFSQWSHHISFPDLAAIPLIRLKKAHEISTTESMRRMMKRFIDQVEQNVDFVQKKRDEVSFSPHDHQSVDLFLQLEKSNLNTPFTQYYRSVIGKAAEKNSLEHEKRSLPGQRDMKRTEAKSNGKIVAAGGILNAEPCLAVENGNRVLKRKKVRASENGNRVLKRKKVRASEGK